MPKENPKPALDFGLPWPPAQPKKWTHKAPSELNPSPAFELKDVSLLAEEAPKRVASVSVTIGPVTVHGLIVWRAKNGHVSVFWPSHKVPGTFNFWLDVIEVAPELREEIEGSIIAAYREKKKQGVPVKPDLVF